MRRLTLQYLRDKDLQTGFEEPGMERQPQRRRRPALSCIECRRRKIRCDRTEPCKNCTSSKIICAYKAWPKQTPAEAVISTTAERGGAHNASEQLLQRPPSTASPPRVSGAATSGTHDQDLRHRLGDGQLARADLSDSSQDGWTILKQQVGVETGDVALNKTRVPRWSEWMGTGPEV